MVRVLFVCLGNICRSPMAEAIFAHLVRDSELQGQIEVDSAGTGDWHVGQPPHHGTRAILRRHNIPECSRARQIVPADLTTYDYVIVMDESNHKNVRALPAPKGARAKVALLLDYAADAGVREVPDPYFTGGFDEVYQLVLAGCEGLLEQIRRDHAL